MGKHICSKITKMGFRDNKIEKIIYRCIINCNDNSDK